MSNIIVIPDSFKGTLDSIEVCTVMSQSIQTAYPDANVIAVPIADGGEGTVDCFLRIQDGTRVNMPVNGPDMTPVDSSYGIFGDTAVIEMAAAAGFAMRSEASTPLTTTTYGVGELIRDAIGRGCKHIILGLGGSCTNDGGCGMAAAMGTRFYNTADEAFVPVGGSLSDIVQIDVSETKALLDGIDVIAMCDVDSPLYGPLGAAHVFAPQKGASPEDVLLLDAQLMALADTIQRDLGIEVQTIPGAGAAGGMGAGVCAFLGGTLVSGIDVLLDTIDFDAMLADCCCVFTGEGKFDSQSLHGKAIHGICSRAIKQNVPVIIVTGRSEVALEEANQYGIVEIFETRSQIREPADKQRYQEDLAATMRQAVRSIPYKSSHSSPGRNA